MKELERRIAEEGKYLPGGILKVDSFINHKIDPKLMHNIGKEIAVMFANSGITKVMTVEASGIAPAIMVGLEMSLPVVYIKKAKPSTMDKCYTTVVHSFTKAKNIDLVLGTDMLSKGDKILFVDDFIANGNTTLAAIDLIHNYTSGKDDMRYNKETVVCCQNLLLQHGAMSMEGLMAEESKNDDYRIEFQRMNQ